MKKLGILIIILTVFVLMSAWEYETSRLCSIKVTGTGTTTATVLFSTYDHLPYDPEYKSLLSFCYPNDAGDDSVDVSGYITFYVDSFPSDTYELCTGIDKDSLWQIHVLQDTVQYLLSGADSVELILVGGSDNDKTDGTSVELYFGIMEFVINKQ